MINFHTNKISAHHNYLVNSILTPGIMVGNPDSKNGFFFLADLVRPEDSHPLISARLMDEQGGLLVEISRNRISENQGFCSFQTISDGFSIKYPSGKSLLEVKTRKFTNGFMTCIKAKLYDEFSNLLIETSGESIIVHGDSIPVEAPFRKII